jgi:hypothetical protein
LIARDPENRLAGRMSRFRLDAELVRDSLLSASGLLSLKKGGPAVYPPQPASVVKLAYGSPNWNVSAGADRFRRSLYTYSKRTAPFAAYSTFDAPTGEICIPRRDRSDTPLQALTLLNDEMFLEMARALAKEVAAADRSPPEAITIIFRRLLTRPPTAEELAALVEYFQVQEQRIVGGELDAGKVAGDSSAAARQAALSMVARAIMNLDEAVTRE